ncbi:AraC family transcriptional regulator [Paenibacillus sp.]|uniref:AraC family transcriptional regulator n=1 Tax=Paenibacillus sp. TaxID=58172 RepID=UPI002D4009E6|nr:AraC family transcriptional regulator [Paenibacillus sp.]HZG57943.1 AraC family transcriptional regulator [Paenibacillus sp.]
MTIYKGDLYFATMDFPFYIDRYTIRKGEVVPSHTHDFVELVYVASGSAKHIMDGREYRLGAGDVFVLEPSVYHSYEGAYAEEAVVYNVLFDISLLRNEIASLQQLPAFVDFFFLAPFLRQNAAFVAYTPLKEPQRALLEQNLNALHREFRDRLDGYPLIVKTRLLECLVLLSRFHRERRQPAVPRESADDYIDTIAKFVERHYSQPISLEEISRSGGMSVSSFTAKFRAAHGQSLIEYKQSIQIREACRLLETTDRKVLDIAHDTGFNDISFFNKMFRKRTGMSPREYRRRSPG